MLPLILNLGTPPPLGTSPVTTAPLWENVYRSIFNAFAGHASMASEYVITQAAPVETIDKDQWFRFLLESFRPETTNDNMIIGRGATRIQANSRSGVEGPVTVYSQAQKTADLVLSVMDNLDVDVRDYVETSGTGTNSLGLVSFGESQIDDLGEAADGVRTIVCTTEFIYSAPRT